MRDDSALSKNPRAHFVAHFLTHWMANPATALYVANPVTDIFTHVFPNAFCI